MKGGVCNPKICLLTGLPRVSVKLKQKIHNNLIQQHVVVQSSPL